MFDAYFIYVQLTCVLLSAISGAGELQNEGMDSGGAGDLKW